MTENRKELFFVGKQWLTLVTGGDWEEADLHQTADLSPRLTVWRLECVSHVMTAVEAVTEPS